MGAESQPRLNKQNGENVMKKKQLTVQLASAASVLVLAGGTAEAQSTSSAGDAAAEEDQVIVTGTRIRASGFEAPTPVTSISAGEVEVRGLTNVADALNQLPAFIGTTTPATTGQQSTSNGTNLINMRGLGPQRTLVLVNERRYVPTNDAGTVNINVIPQVLVERIDSVTGGASASWGSDAVAGVVNLILNRDLDGVRFRSQFGVTGEGDNEDTLISLAVGGDVLDGRGHVVFAGEWNNNEGVGSLSDRDWSSRQTQLVDNPLNTGPNDGIGALTTVNDAALLLASNGGRVVGGPPPIAFTEFDSATSFRPFDPGVPSGIFAVGGEGGNLGALTNLATPSNRVTMMGLFDYDVAENVSFFMEGSFARSTATNPTVPPFSLITGPALILSGNPFIPAGFQDVLTANAVPAFPLFRLNSDLGVITADNSTNVWRTVAGFEGSFLEDWTWQVYAQYGRTDFTSRQLNNIIPGNLTRAVNAVSDPGTGAPVCQSVLDGTDPNCVPINLFGFGSPSAEAIDYVSGTSFFQRTYEQTVVSGSVSGSPFDLPAGPAQVAFGFDYRAEASEGEADELSLNNQWGIVNLQPTEGEFNTKEVFGEVGLPLLSEHAFAHRLDVNGAFRYADYNTIGGVVSWKAGAQYSPVESVTFRGTYSRDIRAPNINELFRGQSLNFPNLIDPENPGAAGLTRVRVGGNPDLQEERSTTITAGFVLQPAYIEGLSLSVDWYDIEIEDAVGSIEAQAILDRCFAGDQTLCAQIERDPSGALTQVNGTILNLGFLETSGIDFELLYGFSGDRVFGAPGDFSLRVFGNHTIEQITSADGLTAIDEAGMLRAATGGIPHWRTNAALSYAQDRFSSFLQLRYVGGGNFDNAFTVEDIDDNSVNGRVYVDVSARYRLDVGEGEVELYGGVNNLINSDPPIIADTFPGAPPTNPAFFDTIGRFFYVGARLDF